VVRASKAKLVQVILLSVLIIQLGFGAVNSSGRRTEPKDAIVPSSAVIGVNATVGLKLTMQVEKAVYSQGEPVNITFTLTNISNQTINFPMTAWTFDFQVLNDTNHLIFQYSTSQVFPQVIWNVPIRPRENLTAILAWPQTCNTTTGVVVSPGTYCLVGLLWSIGRIILQTPPLQIAVGPALTVLISPSSAILHAGGSQTFASSVSGDPPFCSYQWYLNGIAISGATNSSWTFTPSCRGFSTVYTICVKIVDSAGFTATSNIGLATVIRSHPDGGCHCYFC